MKYFIALLFMAYSAYSQNKPLNPHPTKFIYRANLIEAESTYYNFSDSVMKVLMKKPHKFAVIDSLRQGSVDVNSIRVTKDNISFHYYYKSSNDWLPWAFEAASFPLVEGYSLPIVDKVLTIYQSVLKKKGKK